MLYNDSTKYLGGSLRNSMDINNKNKNDREGRKGGCGFCKMEFDLFCGKSGKNITFDEFWNKPPYRPDWCEGQEYTDKFHT